MLEKAALGEAELSGLGIEPNDRLTAMIHRSFNGVSLVAVPSLERYRMSTQLRWPRKTCRADPLSLAGREERRTQVCCPQVQTSELSD